MVIYTLPFGKHPPVSANRQDPVFRSLHRYGHRSVLPVERIFIRGEHVPCRRAHKQESPRKGAFLWNPGTGTFLRTPPRGLSLFNGSSQERPCSCLLYTSDAADDLLC